MLGRVANEFRNSPLGASSSCISLIGLPSSAALIFFSGSSFEFGDQYITSVVQAAAPSISVTLAMSVLAGMLVRPKLGGWLLIAFVLMAICGVSTSLLFAGFVQTNVMDEIIFSDRQFWTPYLIVLAIGILLGVGVILESWGRRRTIPDWDAIEKARPMASMIIERQKYYGEVATVQILICCSGAMAALVAIMMTYGLFGIY